MKTVIGKLINVSGRFWFFVTDAGEELRIHFDGDDRPPVETTIALVISEKPEYEDGGYTCVAEGKYWTFVANSPAGMVNETNKSIALYWQHFPDRDEAAEMRTAEKWAKELTLFYKMYARKKWDIDVRPFLSYSKTKAEPPNYGIQDILHGDKPVDLGGFKPVYHHVSSIYSNVGYCGLGNLNGDKGATYRYGGNCAEHTFIHELGHNFGLHHANDHEKGEYYDKTCVMGMGPSIQGLNGPHLLELKLETDRERIDVNRSVQLLMCPIEIPEHAMHENEWQHVVLEKDGHDKYYLSMRKKKGWPWIPSKYDENTIYIHYRKDGKTWLWGAMGANSTTNPKTLPNGVKLAYLEYANETARIELDYGDGVDVTPVAIPTGFPEVFTGAELGPQHSGLWYDPDLSGQGFDLCVRNGKMTIYWYTYNYDSTLRWYWGTCDLAEGSEEFILYTTHRGTFADPTIAKVEEVGQGQIYFTGPASGVFNYRTTEHGRGSVEIKPVALSQDQRSGLWYDKSKNKSGFSVQFFPHLNKAIFYWYNYGKQKDSYQRKGYQTQRWWLCDCVKTTDMNYAVTIYEAEGGRFGMPIQPTMRTVGNATLKLVSSKEMQFTYQINADDSTSGNGVLNLERLF